MTHNSQEPAFIHIDALPSTNNEIKRLLNEKELPEFSIVITSHQTSGRGQQNNKWESEKGKNLTLSLLIKPQFLEPHLQFYISKITSLAILNLIQKHTSNACIKWPNDIYIGDQKIAGILIENSICGSQLGYSILGIGININQTQFISDAPNPVSLSQLTGVNYALDDLLETFIDLFLAQYDSLENFNFSAIDKEYLSNLYRYNGYHSYKDKNGHFNALINQVDKQGILHLIDQNNRARQYAFKEVEFMKNSDLK